MKIYLNNLIPIDINEAQAFELLLKSVDMEYILDNTIDLYAFKDKYNKVTVWSSCVGGDMQYDERGDLFGILMKLANLIYPNFKQLVIYDKRGYRM